MTILTLVVSLVNMCV